MLIVAAYAKAAVSVSEKMLSFVSWKDFPNHLCKN